MTTFKALLITQENGKSAISLRQLERTQLPPGEVLIRVAYSCLNYKDGLAVTGKPGVIRQFPMVPGIDLSGTVEESQSPDFKPGDEVVVTGCGTAETLWGGYAQLARLNAEFLVPVPKGWSLKQAMGAGTAAFSGMQCIMALEEHGLKPGGREVVVTGATGGVGSTAVAMLANLGYKVAASTGRAEFSDYLRKLGATEILDRAVLATPSSRGLESERWAGAIDNVGGDTLSGLLRSMARGASIGSIGVAGGATYSSTVYPFILRAVSILGIDSMRMPNAARRKIWGRIAKNLPLELLDEMIQVKPLEDIIPLGEKILAGQVRGRIVIDVNQ